ncbi:MAG: M20/M25/M40 family metallo-hydrolase [Thermomonas sp.]|uniref:M20/M25/M40 family metallo-hydrolase n=1 Tax=Thermomonas sp. TaxID=1971895 RepID=UPI0039E62C15
MPRLAALACVLLFALPVAAAQPALAPVEQRITSAVDAGNGDAVALLRRMVEQSSGTHHHAGVEAVAALLKPEFEALGFTVEWKPMAHTGRAGHLIASHRGNGKGQRMLLIGHLDTVFEPDNAFTGFRIEGNHAIGPGVGDDKGGVAVILLALRALHAAGALRDADITVVLTGDEEDVGQPVAQARADLIAAGKRADVALDFENLSHADGRDMGAIARRSSNTWTLTVRGETGHSAGIFSEAMGDGAAFELARILAAFHAELPEPNLTFNVGLLGGGEQAAFAADKTRLDASGKDNIVPGIALARGDFRTLSVEQTRRVGEKMRAIVARHLPRTDATLEIEENYPPMAPTAGNRALLAKLNEVNRDLGLEAMGELDPLSRGAGDISFVAADVDGLVGMGASGGNSHAEGEYIELDSLPKQAKRAALLMHRLALTPR